MPRLNEGAHLALVDVVRVQRPAALFRYGRCWENGRGGQTARIDVALRGWNLLYWGGVGFWLVWEICVETAVVCGPQFLYILNVGRLFVPL